MFIGESRIEMAVKDDSPESRLEWLYSLRNEGIKLGLETITSILDGLGNPQDSYPCVHVAGSDGKGSTCAIIASVLKASGFRVGLYTSPHILRFNERVKVDGREMPDDVLLGYLKRAEEIQAKLEESGRRATFFELTTAIAFDYFREEKVDVAVIEVGMGGRFDATNVVKP